MEGELISRRVKVTEDTTIAKLGVFDQFKLLSIIHSTIGLLSSINQW